MSRWQHAREDLMAEATGLVERAELAVEGWDGPVVVGFRRGGQATLMVGEDWVLQFDAVGALRRAYDAGRLVKAERQRLVELTWRRDAEASVLLRHEMSDDEQEAFLGRVRRTLDDLHTLWLGGKVTILRQIPLDGSLGPLIASWLQARQGPLAVARHPRVAQNLRPRRGDAR